MIVHDLKTNPQFWPHVLDGSLPFEVRRNDRKFRVGDFVSLRQFDPKFGFVDGEPIVRQISYVLHHEDLPAGVSRGYVVLGLGIIRETDDG